MRDQKERVETIESTMKNEFEYALELNLITQEQYNNYLQELDELTSYIYEKYKDSLAFYDEDWIKINDYYEKIVALNFVRDYIKEGLEDSWLIEM
ncbi:hypothetical protein A9G07_05860 [Gilliamella sp. wkB72]|uniref:hypothetical protein n=1 Tax=Gilliamella sp. wkB72 TaxID=3120265 RepID=UPI000810C311|nr:hypothetical protein [Gilliamella apicola]OCL24356.1 hypothetical protein A9G07_05860 [Gilliamella apicola]